MPNKNVENYFNKFKDFPYVTITYYYTATTCKNKHFLVSTFLLVLFYFIKFYYFDSSSLYFGCNPKTTAFI